MQSDRVKWKQGKSWSNAKSWQSQATAAPLNGPNGSPNRQITDFITDFIIISIQLPDQYLQISMGDRKPWTPQEDECLLQLAQGCRQAAAQKLSWGDIAIQLQKMGTKKTGKQCRERWHNQLKPGIGNERQWSGQQQRTLFRQQGEHGNRWALIAKALPGRTDNNVKNYFYCTLRKALRKINTYVAARKKDQRYRNLKEFRDQNLSKILAVAESKYEQKIDLKNEEVIGVARSIKNMLIEIQLSQAANSLQQPCPIVEQAVHQILEFNRNCKRRKTKKKDLKSRAEQEDGLDHFPQSQDSNRIKSLQQQRGDKKLSKREKGRHKTNKLIQAHQGRPRLGKLQEEQLIDFLDQPLKRMDGHNFNQLNNQAEVIHSAKISGEREKGQILINLSSLYERSSSLNGLTPAILAPNQYDQELNLIDLMPVYESKRAEEIHGGLFMQQNLHHLQPLPFIDQTRVFNPFEEDNRVLGYFQSKQKMNEHEWRGLEMDQYIL